MLPPSLAVTLGPLAFALVVTALSLLLTLETFALPSPPLAREAQSPPLRPHP